MYNYCYTVRGGCRRDIKSGGTAESKAHSSCKGYEPFLFTLKALHSVFYIADVFIRTAKEKIEYKAPATPTRSGCGVEVRRAWRALKIWRFDGQNPMI